MSVKDKIKEIESRFIEIAGIDISDVPLNDGILPFPLTEEHHLQVETNKEKSDEFGEVFTPLWLVDKMLNKTDTGWADDTTRTLDMCSGYGQFTIRMISKKYNVLGENFNIDKFLTDTHFLNELQLESCYKLLYIYGTDINLLIGDSMQLRMVKDDSRGIWYYFEEHNEWNDVTDIAKRLMEKYPNPADVDKWVKDFKYEMDNYVAEEFDYF